MAHNRRDFLKTAVLGGAFASYRPSTVLAGPRSAAAAEPGIPGPFPGRVVSVRHSGTYAGEAFQAEPIRQSIHRGVMELTGADTPQDAWRYFFQPGDVVGLKLNGVGRPFVISSPETVHAIVEGLEMAGIPRKDIIAYDRERRIFLQCGFDTWLPDGVRWTFASDQGHPLQLDMEGYDADQYVEVPLVLPSADPTNPHHRRSYLAKFITQDVNKMINLTLLKHHQSAGVTLALKNLSHGLVNNVSRSHSSPTLNTCGWFIPAIVDHPTIRQKVVLNMIDGVLGAYHGGPGRKVEKYVWPHSTFYFSTDPVAVDKVCWRVIDEKRAEMGMEEVGKAAPDADSSYYRMQPEHVEISAAMGLGLFKDEDIDHRAIDLG